jgi:hypothetical protein
VRQVRRRRVLRYLKIRGVLPALARLQMSIVSPNQYG